MRETLTREWDENLPGIAFIGCNPGKANGDDDDATSRKYVGFASRWGFGFYVAGNLWQWVATNQRELIKMLCANLAINPPDPDSWLSHLDRDRVQVVCYAWGRAPSTVRDSWERRERQVVAAVRAIGLRRVVAAINKDGSPAHLSRLGYTDAPIELR
jgi:hypothetical protein